MKWMKSNSDLKRMTENDIIVLVNEVPAVSAAAIYHFSKSVTSFLLAVWIQINSSVFSYMS